VLLLWEDGKQEVVVGDPFEVLRGFLECYRIARLADLPLVGGAVGYFGYDLCHFIEHLPAEARDDLELPEAYLGFYDALMAFDHRRGRAYLVSTGLPGAGSQAAPCAKAPAGVPGQAPAAGVTAGGGPLSPCRCCPGELQPGGLPGSSRAGPGVYRRRGHISGEPFPAL